MPILEEAAFATRFFRVVAGASFGAGLVALAALMAAALFFLTGFGELDSGIVGDVFVAMGLMVVSKF